MITETQSQCCISQALLWRCGEPSCQRWALHTCTLSSSYGESQGELSFLLITSNMLEGPGSATEIQLNPQKCSSYLLTWSLPHSSACGSTALATRRGILEARDTLLSGGARMHPLGRCTSPWEDGCQHRQAVTWASSPCSLQHHPPLLPGRPV